MGEAAEYTLPFTPLTILLVLAVVLPCTKPLPVESVSPLIASRYWSPNAPTLESRREIPVPCQLKMGSGLRVSPPVHGSPYMRIFLPVPSA